MTTTGDSAGNGANPPGLDTKTATAVALAEHRKGYCPIPDLGKRPAGPNWQNTEYRSEGAVRGIFGSFDDGVNVGRLCGVAGITDVDLDCPEAVAAARYLLPTTPVRSGRFGALDSHWWYRVPGGPPDYAKFLDPDGSTLVEYRGSTKQQTVIPPSIHPETHKPYVWSGDANAEPAETDHDTLMAEVAAVAVASLLTRAGRFPSTGSRHDAYLALTGGLLRGAPDDPALIEITKQIITAIAELTGDEEAGERIAETVRSTRARLAGDEPATGFTSLGGLLSDNGAVTGRDVARTATRFAAKLRGYLGVPYLNGDREAGNGESSNGSDRSNGNAATPEEEAEEARREIARLARNERWWRAAKRQVDDEEAAQLEAPDPGVLGVAAMFARYQDSAGRHVVANTIPRRGTGSFFGESGAGKSTCVTALSLHLGHGPGAKWFGCEVTERVASLNVPFEAGHEAHLKACAQAAALGYGAEELSLLRWWPESALTVLSERRVEHFIAGVAQLRDELASKGIRLGMVWIDTQRHLHAGRSINDDTATSLVTGLLTRLAALDLFAAVVQHTPVADTTRVAGSGEQKGAKDVQIGFIKGKVDGKDGGKAEIEKSRFDVARELGHYQMESHRPVDQLGRVLPELEAADVTVGVMRELTDDEVVSDAVRAMLADRKMLTQCEILARIGTPPAPTGPKAQQKAGWSDSQVVNLMRDIAKRVHHSGCPMAARTEERRPFKDRPVVKKLLDQLGEAGLAENLAGSRQNGKPAEWLATPSGTDWVTGLGGGVCTCS